MSKRTRQQEEEEAWRNVVQRLAPPEVQTELMDLPREMHVEIVRRLDDTALWDVMMASKALRSVTMEVLNESIRVPYVALKAAIAQHDWRRPDSDGAIMGQVGRLTSAMDIIETAGLRPDRIQSTRAHPKGTLCLPSDELMAVISEEPQFAEMWSREPVHDRTMARLFSLWISRGWRNRRLSDIPTVLDAWANADVDECLAFMLALYYHSTQARIDRVLLEACFVSTVMRFKLGLGGTGYVGELMRFYSKGFWRSNIHALFDLSLIHI